MNTAQQDVARAKRAYTTINAKGAAIILKSVGEAVYDPATGAAVSTVTEYPMRAVWQSSFGKRISARGSAAGFGDDLALKLNRFVTIAAYNLGFTPRPGDFVRMEEFDWRVLDVTPTHSRDTPIIYNLVCAK